MAYSGTAGSVVYNSGGTPAVDGIAEWSLNMSRAAVETTAFGDGWAKNIYSVGSFTGSFSGNSTAGTAQEAMTDALIDGTTVALRLYESDTDYWVIGTALITGSTRGISQTGKGDVSFEFTGSDAISYTNT